MNDLTNIALYGAGYLGVQILHHLRTYEAARTRILGFIDDTKPAGEPIAHGLRTLGPLDAMAQNPALAPDHLKVVFAIGYTNMLDRSAALQRVLHGGYELFTFVHPQALVEPGAVIQDGCTVLGGAVLDQNTHVGTGCFVDIGVRLGAGTRIGNNNYLSSGTSTGSRVVIGNDCFFGMDCTVTTDVHIGNNVFANAKTLIPRNVADNVKLVELHKSRELPNPSGR